MDEHTISPQGYVTESVLIPTRVSLLHQKKKCGTGHREKVCTYKTFQKDNYFVAGIENFTLLFRHTFSADTDTNTIRGSNFDHDGYVQRCDNQTEGAQCKGVKLHEHGHPEANSDLYHIIYGDVMSFGALLDMANTSLDHSGFRNEGLDLVV